MEIVKEKLAKAPEFLKKKLGIDNVMATPKILKVVVSRLFRGILQGILIGKLQVNLMKVTMGLVLDP